MPIVTSNAGTYALNLGEYDRELTPAMVDRIDAEFRDTMRHYRIAEHVFRLVEVTMNYGVCAQFDYELDEQFLTPEDNGNKPSYTFFDIYFADDGELLQYKWEVD